MSHKKIFGERLKQLRKGKGVSARVAAELCGTSESVWRHYETGRSYSSIQVLLYIADYFNVSTDYLLGRTDKK